MESLLVLNQKEDAALRRDIQSHRVRIVQEASPRVLVIEGTPEEVRALERRDGVHAVPVATTSAGGVAMLDLTTGEALFVRAWLRRQTDTPSPRLGEGRNWDAPGFIAP